MLSPLQLRYDACIAFHIHDALDKGVTKQEILETIGLTLSMGSGPTLVYGCEALPALEQVKKKDFIENL